MAKGLLGWGDVVLCVENEVLVVTFFIFVAFLRLRSMDGLEYVVCHWGSFDGFGAFNCRARSDMCIFLQ